MMPASTIIRRRLAALIAAAGTYPHKVSEKCGWARGSLAAKLAEPLREDGTTNPNARPLTVQDVDAVLQALGLDATALLP